MLVMNIYTATNYQYCVRACFFPYFIARPFINSKLRKKKCLEILKSTYLALNFGDLKGPSNLVEQKCQCTCAIVNNVNQVIIHIQKQKSKKLKCLRMKHACTCDKI